MRLPPLLLAAAPLLAALLLAVAAMLAGAAKIVIGHTHPSGNPTPSTEDLVLTRRIVTGGTLLGIACVDHVIVGCNYGGPMPAPALSLRSTNPAIFVE